MPKVLRITTVPISLKVLLQGQFRFMQQNGWEVLTVSAEGTEVQEIKEKEAVKHISIPLTRQISPLTDLVALWKLIRIINTFKPDIVHSHTPKAGLIGMLAAWLCRVPNRLHTVAGLPLMEYSGLKRLLLNTAEKLTYRFATKVYPNSFQLFEFIKNNLYQNSQKFRVIGKGSSNGIDIEYFTPNKYIEDKANDIRFSFNIPPNAFVFLFIGRLVKDKGIIELVQAFDEVIKANDAYLLLVGLFESDLDPLPQDILDKITNHPKIKLSGFQKDVRPFLMASNAFVFPSYREGFPNVVLQAACMEVPVIATNINGCNEIIEHERSGLLVKPKDSKELKVAMLRMIQNEVDRECFRTAAATYVRMNFSRTHFWTLLLAEYKSLVK
ncbi:MAG: glycosyltransferase family 4 protein [Cyclobacteriaceae bacterium]|nr:glycosyltransferase family 4 protein [Cytophagales bacterium]MCZ8327604.1 glycosyltransferase family 4 protein [Cyclobacteriaceae bacterium]